MMRSGALRGHRVHHIVIQRFVACAQSAGELVSIQVPPFDHLGDRHFRRRGLLIGLAGIRTSAHEAADRSQQHQPNTCCPVVPCERVGARSRAQVDCAVLRPSVGGIARARRHAAGLSPANLRNTLLK